MSLVCVAHYHSRICCLANSDASIATRFAETDFHLHRFDRRLRGAQPRTRFISFVRAYARSGCLVELNLNLCSLSFSLFSFGFGELSLFSFGLEKLSIFHSPPPPKPPFIFSWAYRSTNICEFGASTHAHATGKRATTIQRCGIDANEKGLR